jgi:DNA-binding MarR family transcriptional regulator
LNLPASDTTSLDNPLSALPGFALRRAANAMMAELAARLAQLDLKISDASVLLLVDGRHDLTSSEIGKLLDIQRANMVPLLNRLEGAGLIAREPIDRKSQAIVLTQGGQLRLDAVRDLVGRFEADLMGRIPAEHRGHFMPALHALIV